MNSAAFGANTADLLTDARQTLVSGRPPLVPVSMNRRSFLVGLPGLVPISRLLDYAPKTKHVVFIVNGGGVRKKDYYEEAALSPNIHRLVRDGFVFEQDHCEAVASHDAAFELLLPNVEYQQVDSINEIPRILQSERPRVVVCRQMGHDVGHHSYEQYLATVKATDDAIGLMFDWLLREPEFAGKTAIVIRPEFGRDDEINPHGQLHHSFGFYYTHRVASIFWGPDFNRGVDRTTVIHSVDMAPTLTKLLGVSAIHARGRVVPGLFRV